MRGCVWSHRSGSLSSVVEECPRRVAAGVARGLEPGDELVLVHDPVAGVGRIREAAALRGARLVEAHRQPARSLRHVAAAGLVGRHVPGDGHGHQHRRTGREGARDVGADRLARSAAAAQEGVVLVLEVGAGVRGVRLPVVGGPAVAAQPAEPEAARAPAPVGLVGPVDERRDRRAPRRRVDRETDRAGRPRQRAGRGRSRRRDRVGRGSAPASADRRGETGQKQRPSDAKSASEHANTALQGQRPVALGGAPNQNTPPSREDSDATSVAGGGAC